MSCRGDVCIGVSGKLFSLAHLLVDGESSLNCRFSIWRGVPTIGFKNITPSLSTGLGLYMITVLWKLW